MTWAGISVEMMRICDLHHTLEPQILKLQFTLVTPAQFFLSLLV